jgi:hypothetical protein
MTIAKEFVGGVPAAPSAPMDRRAATWAERIRDREWTETAPFAVVMSALFIALSAGIWSAATGSMALYGDARSHLNVARHVFDNLTPGLAQLGSVWLPLPQMLMMPFAALDPLWRSGMAGAIVSGAAFVYSAVRIYSLAQYWTKSRLAGWCAFALYATALNLLYVQTTALTESLLLAMMVGAVYHLARWLREMKYRDLTLAATFTFLATLTRYDGWFLLGTGLIIVLIWTKTHDRRAHTTQANVVIFGLLAGYGVVLWLLYNAVIFGDPIYWQHSATSAQAQQLNLIQYGLLPTKGNIPESTLEYLWATLDVAGPALVAVGLVGAVVMLLRRGTQLWANIALLVLLFCPFVFNVLAMWTGNSTIRVPQRGTHEIWNVRYGLMMLPAFAAAGGMLVARWRPLAVPVVAAALAGVVTMGITSTPITLQDGRSGVSAAFAGQPEVAAGYVASHYEGGRILADDSVSSMVIFKTSIPLKEFVTVGNKPYYEEALTAPAENVAWVITRYQDQLDQDIKGHPERFARFELVKQDHDISVYRRL